jgi:hypothetical protein
MLVEHGRALESSFLQPEVLMNSLIASPVSGSPHWGTVLTREELDTTSGGGVPLVGWFIGAFIVSVGIGAIDRILFGGCTCR